MTRCWSANCLLYKKTHLLLFERLHGNYYFKTALSFSFITSDKDEERYSSRQYLHALYLNGSSSLSDKHKSVSQAIRTIPPCEPVELIIRVHIKRKWKSNDKRTGMWLYISQISLWPIVVANLCPRPSLKPSLLL